MYDIMVLLHLWNSILFLLTAVRTTGCTFSGTEKDIMHAIAGNPFMIRTWSMIGSTLFITIRKDNNIILDVSMGVGINTNSTVQKGRMLLGYNHTIQELYLWFENVSKEEEGIYEMKETLYRTNSIEVETEADTYDRRDGTWYLEIYVLGPGEIKKGFIGGNISMEFEKLIKQSNLYNYGDHCALLAASSCSVSTDSSLYGRLRCSNDDSGRMYKITIVNVSQRDAGLYKMATGRNETGRCFFSIEDSPICTVVGDNMTIGWFYNQQGIQRTLMVIHPNQEVIMQLAPSNVPEIKSKFKHRLSYKGDVSRNFMMLSLLNVTMSDAGVYTLETLHGNTIPGSKQLNVEAVCTTTSSTMTNLPLSVPLHPYSVRRTFEPATELLSTRQEPMNTRYIAIVSGSVSVIILMIIAFIYLQRRNNFRLDADISTLLPVSQWNEERSEQSDAQSGLTCNEILGLHYAAIKDLTTVYTEGSNNYSLSEIEDQNNLSDNSNGISSAACDYDAEERILGEPPSVSALQTTISDDDNEINGVVSGEVAENIQDLYAKVNKRPISSSSNTEKRNPRHEHANETEENNGHETFKTVLNLMSTKDANVYADADEAAIEIKNMEPTEDMILPVTSCEDYSDTLL